MRSVVIAAAPAAPTGLEDVAATTWLLAVAPLALLVVLVLWGRLSTPVNAMLTLAVAIGLAAGVFGADAIGLAVGMGKGLWTGAWILGVVWTALLLHRSCQRMGLDGLGGSLSRILRRPVENILIAAWIFPSFVQGVAGFGTPVVVSAPLLVSMGVRPVLAVALPLVGYHWSVGFGSVGSSFYVGALTAQLGPVGTDRYAAIASLLLGLNALLAGVLVALMYGGWRGLRDGWRLLLLAGPAMAGVQAAVVRLEPGVGALAGGTAGLLVVAALAALGRQRRGPRADDPVPAASLTPAAPATPTASASTGSPPELLGAGFGGVPGATHANGSPAAAPLPGVGRRTHGVALLLIVVVAALTALRRRRRDYPADDRPPSTLGPTGSTDPDAAAGSPEAGPGGRRVALVLLPYLLLLVTVLGVLLPPASRAWARSFLAWGPSFPATRTDLDFMVPAVVDYQPVAPLGHPGGFILLATFGAVLLWVVLRRWPRRALRKLAPEWWRAARKASPAVLLLVSVATVMADAGMVRTVAVGVAEVTGDVYPALAGVVGALGSFVTGSTTSSNALFAALQADIAEVIDVPPVLLVAAQLAGGNVGNAVAPVVVVLGAAAVGVRDRVGEVLRLVLLPAAVLLASVIVTTTVLAALLE